MIMYFFRRFEVICIFLDDERDPIDVTWIAYPNTISQWIVVRTYEQFIALVPPLLTDEADATLLFSFDHDLQDYKSSGDGTERTGYDCIKFLVNFCLDTTMCMPLCAFHTKNVIGKVNMEQYYINAKQEINK